MYRLLMQACGVMAAVTVALITLLVCYDVVGRNLGLPTFIWTNEVTEYAMPILTLFSAPWLMWRNQHVRLDLLGASLSQDMQRHVDRAASLVCFVISVLMIWYSMAMLLDSRSAGSLVLKALVFPEWWTYIPMPIGFALLAVECGRRVLFPAGLTENLEGTSS